MTFRLPLLGSAGLLTLLSSCAGSYTPIQPARIATYQSAPSAGPIDFAYQFDALRLAGGNKKYVKKEAKKNYRVVAVRLTNNGTQEINFSRDLTMYLGDRPVSPVPTPIAVRDLRQGVPIYLLYVLLNPTISTSTSSQNGQTENSVFLPIGPFIAGGNMIAAGSANSNLRREFTGFDLTNRTIRPGETVYGIVSLHELAVAPLRVELRGGAPTQSATYPSPAAPAQSLPSPPPAAPGTTPR